MSSEATVPKGEYSKAKKYITTLMRTLRIEWDVFLETEYHPNVKASVLCFPNVREATLRLGEWWPHLDAGTRRSTLTHEMVHIMNSEAVQFVNRSLVPALPKGGRKIAATAFDDLDEQFVDRISWQLAKYMPEYPS